MKTAERIARQAIARLSTKEVVEQFEITEGMNISMAVITLRGWLMDELEARDAEAYDKWIDGDIKSPREYFL